MGPALLVYLLSTAPPKQEMIRVQGAVFLIGAERQLAAHRLTGIANAQTLAFSAALVIAGQLGTMA